MLQKFRSLIILNYILLNMIKNKSSKKILAKLNRAWLIQWTFMSDNENERLKKIGINEKIIGVVSARKKFDEIYDITLNIYAQSKARFSEKISFAHYLNGKENKERFCKLNGPIYTHYTSAVYDNLVKYYSTNSKKHNQLKEKWKNYSEFICIGYNPGLLTEKVYNIKVYESNNNEIIEYDKKLTTGKLKKKKYEFRKNCRF